MEMISTNCPVCIEKGNVDPPSLGENGQNLLYCGGCQSIAYCSREHQKMDWKIHKKTCTPFKIVQDPLLGSQWIATRDLPPNSLLLEESPILYYLNWTGINDPICLACGTQNGRLCSTCGWPICSEKCEQNPMHKDNECHVFIRQKIPWPPSKKVEKWFQKKFNSKLNETNVISTCIGLIRALRLMTLDPKNYENFLTTVQRLGHSMSKASDEESEIISFQLLKNLINLKDLNVDLIDWQILKKMVTSPLGKNDEKMAIYLKTSQANHSCSPNCFLEPAPSFKVRVKTMTGVKKGEPLTDNYMRRDLGRINRRGRQLIILMEKGFKCLCKRCLDPTECGSYMDAVACTNCRSGGSDHDPGSNLGYLLPINGTDLRPLSQWQCNGCHGTESYETILKLTESLPDELASILDQNNNKSISENDSFKNLAKSYQIFEDRFGPKLHPNHFGLMMAADGLIQTFQRSQLTCVDLQRDEFDLILNKAKYLLTIGDKVSPGNSTMRHQLLNFLIKFSINGCRRLDLNQDEKLALIIQADLYRIEL